MLFALLIATALADCDTDAEGFTAWPDQVQVGTDTRFTITGNGLNRDDVALVNTTTGESAGELQSGIGGCGLRDGCSMPFWLDAGLDINTEYTIQLADETLASFTTSDAEQWSAPPEIPQVRPASITDTRSSAEDSTVASYPAHVASWTVSNYPPQHFVEYEVMRLRGGESVTRYANTNTLEYGWGTCGEGTGDREFVARSQLRARFATPAGITGPWSEWVDAPGVTEPSSSCSSLPAPLLWLWSLPVVALVFRQRQN